MADTVDSMLDLMRRLPPPRVAENVAALARLAPEHADELLGSVDQPLIVRVCPESGREYLACDYNRDGESWRSPWSNAYDPPLEDGTAPSPKLRKLEVQANAAFDTYRELYYDGPGGLSSVYLWDLDDGGFAGVVLLKKTLEGGGGSWDSIHVFEAAERGRTAHYKLTSTIMLALTTRSTTTASSTTASSSGPPSDTNTTTTLSGSMTRQIETDGSLTEPNAHVGNLGRAIEEMEGKMRALLQEVYFGKTRDVVYEMRSVEDLERARKQRDLQRELVGFMGQGGKARTGST